MYSPSPQNLKRKNVKFVPFLFWKCEFIAIKRDSPMI